MNPLREAIQTAVEDVESEGLEVAPGRYGVCESYDAELTLRWQRTPRAPSVCPLGAAALKAPAMPKSENRKARSATKVAVALAAAIGVHPDYVFGFAQGFDQREKWHGVDYGSHWQSGFDDGVAVHAWWAGRRADALLEEHGV